MSSPSSELTSSLGYAADRFSARIARPEDLPRCYEIRQQVFGDELKRISDTVMSPAMQDCYDDNSVIIAGWDTHTEEIVATLRITPATAMQKDPSLVEIYHLNDFLEDELNGMRIFSRLCILEAYRKTSLSLVMANFIFKYCLENDVSMGLIICEPNLYHFYRSFGFRPLSHAYNSPFGGYRLPLFLLPHDYDFLKLCDSPFYKIAEDAGFPKNEIGLKWFSQEATKIMLVDPGFSQVTSGGNHMMDSQIFHGITPEGRDSLLKNAMNIHCNPKDVIISKNAGDRTFGIITQGLAEVCVDGEVISILGRGDIFGEISFILGVPRTADVIAAIPDTTVVLLSLSCLKRLHNEDDTVAIWQNLARVLAARLANMANYNKRYILHQNPLAEIASLKP